MKKSALCLPFLLLFATGTQAQDADACPQLTNSAGLSWEYRGGSGSDFCRALREDGSEAFGMYISKEPAFTPKRGNREEVDTIDGQEVQWYRAELAGQPGIEARETLIKLDDGRTAHVWLQAASGEQLQNAFQMTRGLDFSPPRTNATIAAGQ
ncbi:MAG TPA: hypothetical protein VFS82_00050 [Lysobacter sp.]|nr:hypothetical protein [Lysobacter sp.]